MPRRISVSNGPTAGGGYLLPAGQKVKVRDTPSEGRRASGKRRHPVQGPLVNRQQPFPLESDQGRRRDLKIPRACCASREDQGIMMAPLCQNQPGQDKPAGDLAWTVLDAANDLGDTATIEACRRGIDANLRGVEPATSDMAIVVAFFG